MEYDEPGDLLDRWRRGRTGFPIVDAGMRQLRETGWMHNRVRMIVASFLVKDLHVEWQHGARHFMQHLVDGDLASNQHGWQWTAGCGTDAAPYFRVFNPVTQGQQVRPRRRLRTPLGARARRRRRPARHRSTRSSTTPRSAARRSPGGRGSGRDRAARPPPVRGPALLGQRRLDRRRARRAARPRPPGRPRRGVADGPGHAAPPAAARRADAGGRRGRDAATATPVAVAEVVEGDLVPVDPVGARRGRRGRGDVPGLHHPPLPDLLRVRARARGGRRAADLPGPGRRRRTAGPGWPRRGRRTRRSPRTTTSTATTRSARRCR